MKMCSKEKNEIHYDIRETFNKFSFIHKGKENQIVLFEKFTVLFLIERMRINIYQKIQLLNKLREK